MTAQHQDFEAFVIARSPALLRTAHRLTGDRGHGEDLLQQALERLYRHWRRIDGDPEGWTRRTVLVLRFFDDLPEARVAEVLGCSVGTVKSTQSKALSRLRPQSRPADLTRSSS